MQIESIQSHTVTTNTYVVKHKGKRYSYLEYMNAKNKVIDSNLLDEDDNEVCDPVLFEEIQEFVDKKYPNGLNLN